MLNDDFLSNQAIRVRPDLLRLTASGQNAFWHEKGREDWTHGKVIFYSEEFCTVATEDHRLLCFTTFAINKCNSMFLGDCKKD